MQTNNSQTPQPPPQTQQTSPPPQQPPQTTTTVPPPNLPTAAISSSSSSSSINISNEKINFESYAKKCQELNNNSEWNQLLALVTEIRENIELLHTIEYPTFLSFLFPIFYNILKQGAVQFVDNTEQKIRSTILDIFNKLPNNEYLRSNVLALLQLSMYLLEVDNEENGLICLRIIIDLHRNYRNSLEGEVQSFLNIVLKLYTDLPQVVEKVFYQPQSAAAATSSTTSPSQPGTTATTTIQPPTTPPTASTINPQTPLALQPCNIKGIESFKVLTECPIIVILLFQLYNTYMNTNVPKFKQNIMDTLSIQIPNNVSSLHHQQYVDFVAAQVKTLYLLAYILKSNKIDQTEKFPKAVIQLLQNCPPHSLAIRKELLVTLRHILSSDFKINFLPFLDTLLEEKVLLGTSKTSYESLRSMAYGSMADFIHNVRSHLTLAQVSKVVSIYSRHLHDSSNPLSIQTISVKLIISLMDSVLRRSDPPDVKCRPIIYKMIDSFINKFSSIKRTIPKLLADDQKEKEQKDKEQKEGKLLSDSSSVPPPTTVTSSIQQQQQISDGAIVDPIKDTKVLFKTMVSSLRTIFWGLSHVCKANNAQVAAAQTAPNTTASPTSPNAAQRFALTPLEESLLFIKLFKSATKCFPLYADISSTTPQEEKEIIEHLSSSFVILDNRTFQEVISYVLPFLYNKALEYPSLLLVAQYFLSPNVVIPSNSSNRIFLEILTPFLFEKFKNLTPADRPDICLIRLTKLLFGTVHSNSILAMQPGTTTQPMDTSTVQQLLSSIILIILKLITESRQIDSIQYLLLLKSIFRSCTRPDQSKEITLLIPVILETLNDLLHSSCYPQPALQLIIELCLTIPVQIVTLLPTLYLLVKPLMMALSSNSSDLLITTFKILELIVDNATGDFLLFTFRENKTEFLSCIYRHIKPTPYFFGPHAIRILGKMADIDPKSNVFKLELPSPTTTTTTDENTGDFSISLDKSITTIKNILLYNNDDSYLQKNAFALLKYYINLYLLNEKDQSQQIDFTKYQETLLSELEESLKNVNNDKTISTVNSNIIVEFNSNKDNEMVNQLSLASLSISQMNNDQKQQQPIDFSNIKIFKTKDEYLNEIKNFKDLIYCLFLSISNDTLKNQFDSLAFLNNFIYHFVLYLSLSSNSEKTLTINEIEPKVFLQALIDVISISSYNIVNNEAIQQQPQSPSSASISTITPSLLSTSKFTSDHINSILDIIFKCSNEIYSTLNSNSNKESNENSSEKMEIESTVNQDEKDDELISPIYKYLIESFIQSCYDKDYSIKGAGLIGIRYILNNVKISWINRYQHLLVKAILFVTEDLSYSGYQPYVDYASDLITSLLKICVPTLTAPEKMEQEESNETTTTTTTTTTTSSSSSLPPSEQLTQPLESPPTASATTTASTTTALNQSTNISPIPEKPLKPHCTLNHLNSKDRARLNLILECLISNIVSPSMHTRQIAQRLLLLVADDITKIPIHLLIGDVKDCITKLLPKTSLKTFTISFQTGLIEGLNFCLTQKPTLLEINSDSVRVLQECLNVAGDENSTNVQTIKANSARNIALINKLRVSGVELVATCMLVPEFLTYECTDFKNRIIRMFFKAVTARNKDIASAAKKGLSNSISHQRIHRELLQSCLRPVLANLTDPRHLSVPFLQGLSRLLELLSNFFNAALGEKLFEYLKKFDDLGKLSYAVNKYKDSDDVKICASIIDIFHLLLTAAKLLESTIQLTIKLEQGLCKEVTSPFREPLVRFLAKYPTKTIEIFMASPQYNIVFRLILKQKELSKPILEEMANTYSTWLESNLKSSNPDTRYHIISIVNIIRKSLPNWLPENRKVLDILIEYWRILSHLLQNTANPADITNQTLKETKILVKCFIQYCRAHKEETDLYFYMLSVLSVKSYMDFNFLRDFYQNELIVQSSIEQKKKIITTFLIFFKDHTIPSDNKVQAIQNLINPILTAYFTMEPSQRAIEDIVFLQLTKQTLEPDIKMNDELLLIELLQMESILFKNMAGALGECRKELIKFAWSHLKNEDIIVKQYASILTCGFIEAYETPPKIILQIFVSFLRSYQPETKQLVKQGLDLLLPTFKLRFPPCDPKNSAWIKWTKKIVVEESHTTAQLAHVIQLIVRKSQYFYHNRSQFIPHMVLLLPRIALGSNLTSENKKLALDIAETILVWERMRLSNLQKNQKSNINTSSSGIQTPQQQSFNQPPSTPFAEGVTTPSQNISTPNVSDSSMTQQNTPSDDDYKPPQSAIEHISLFLIRMSTAWPNISDKSTELLRQYLTLWPEVNIKFSVFEKPLNSPDPPVVSTALSMINLVAEFHINTFIPNNIVSLQHSLLPALNNDNPKISGHLCSLFKKILVAFPISKETIPSEISSFYKFISTQIEMILGSFEKNYNLSILSIIKIFKDEDESFIDPYIGLLIKVLVKLIKNYLNTDEASTGSTTSASGSTTAGTNTITTTSSGAIASGGTIQSKPPENASSTQNKKSNSEIIQSLSKTFEFLKVKTSKLNDEQKKTLIQSLLAIIEKSNDIDLLKDVVSVIDDLIKLSPSDTNTNSASISTDTTEPTATNPNTPFLSTKEKVNFLFKMSRLEQLNNQDLFLSYYNLVLNLYNDNNTSKQEISQLEPCFMMGLRCNDPKIRKSFFEILNNSISKDPYQRLNYIVSIHQWDTFGLSYWIRHAVDLLLAVLPSNKLVRLSNSCSNLPKVSLTKNLLEQQSNDNDNDNEFIKSLKLHYDWLNEISLSTSNEYSLFNDNIRELIFVDPFLTNDLWCSLFSSIWGQVLGKEEQFKLTKSLTVLLSKDYSRRIPLVNKPSYPTSYLLPVPVKASSQTTSNIVSNNPALQPINLVTLYQQQQSNSVIVPSLNEPNVIKTFIQSIDSCSPNSPKIPVELIAFLGESYNCWYSSIKLIEEHLICKQKVVSDSTDIHWDYLSYLYKGLNEKDALYGIYRKRYHCDETKLGLLLDQFYMYQSSQEVFLSAMNKYSLVGAKPTPKSENLLWEDSWLECAKRLNQWNFLYEYSKEKNLYELSAESAWKNSQWNLISNSIKRTTLQGDSSMKKIMNGYYLTHDKKFNEVDPLIVSANQMILDKWVSLPERSIRAHSPYLVEMQQVVELQESVHILKEIATVSTLPSTDPSVSSRAFLTSNYIKSIFGIWRERLPNKDEDIKIWYELLQWRQQLFNTIAPSTPAGAEQPSPPLPGSIEYASSKYMVLETAWSMNKYSHVVRKYNMIEVCLNSLGKMFDLSIELHDIFLNLKEQIKCYLQLPTHYGTGISIVNSTNLDYFNPLQKGEFLQLKGEFLNRLGNFDEANLSFATSVNIYENFAKSWISWAHFCDNQFTNHSVNTPNITSSSTPDIKSQWAESAISCYIQGIKCDPKYGSRYIPRIFWLLMLNGSGEVPQLPPPSQQPTPQQPPSQQPSQTSETSSTSTTTADSSQTTAQPPQKKMTSAQAVFSAFLNSWTILPQWVWINFVPQLITGAMNLGNFQGYGFLCWQMIGKVCYLYPNSTYYHFRKLVIEIKSNPSFTQKPTPATPSTAPTPTPAPTPAPTADNSTTEGSTTAQTTAQTTTATSTGTSTTSNPTPSQPTPIPPLKMADSLSGGLNQFHSCLINEIDIMLNIITTLSKNLPAIYQFNACLHKIITDSFNNEMITKDIKDMIKTLHNHFFIENIQYPNSEVFVEKLKVEFENQFKQYIGDNLMDTNEETINDLLKKLIDFNDRPIDPSLVIVKYSNGTSNYFSEGVQINIESISDQILDFKPNVLEVPGQSNPLRDPNTDFNVKVEKMSIYAKMIKHSNGLLCPRITLFGTNGKSYNYLIESTPVLTFEKIKAPSRSIERRSQLLGSINTMLMKNRETRRRGITFNSNPPIIPINQNISLIQCIGNENFKTLSDIWYDNSNQTNIFYPMLKYKEKLSNKTTTANINNDGDQMSVDDDENNSPGNSTILPFREMLKETGDDLFIKFIDKMFSNYQDQYEFKLHFATHFGLYSTLQYLFFSDIGKISPSEIYFNRWSGSVFYSNWELNLTDRKQNFDLLKDRPENQLQLLRLSPNIRNYLGPFIIEGSYLASLVGTCICISELKDQFVNLINLYIFDEYLCLHNVEPLTQTEQNKDRHIHYEFIERTTKTVNQMLENRVDSLTSTNQPDKTLFISPIVKKVNELIQNSLTSNISELNQISCPWL
ncbi:hypothetical protein DICPUDRAFT_151088 [Dictyostelium purpureum]|uniref:Uncharacterized protein n=1 Tax=Dictyostelium purpureum TaxID=5786 RepID=F0ZHY9_DICPU|nr:uncharacterized protein DICPUDRAFT_151088 [Dictyostelium purpureum]EGC36462.1 hypothetical protein DICPUDRAFT_151088 [Dictyostelium purpureum]|eukprot:XP_003287034.1 hypothetical protein DICPUDRAFT_151088 [Dictyostelium purpureum]